jgi:hypothetical protein
MRHIRSFGLIAAFAAITSSAAAQTAMYRLPPAVGSASSAAADSGHWNWTIAPYLLMPTMQGTTGIGNLPPLKIDASADEIFSHLQFGMMLYFQAQKGPWAFVLDGIYMDLKQDVASAGSFSLISGSVTMKQFAAEGFAFRQVSHGFEGAIGVLVNSIQASGTITIATPGPTTQSSSKTKTWAVPVLGFRWTPVNTPKWRVVLFADIGGTSGNNWTYQVLPSVAYNFSKLFSTAIQYRWLGLDYETGSGSDLFRYDMNIFGPEIAFAFHF